MAKNGFMCVMVTEKHENIPFGLLKILRKLNPELFVSELKCIDLSKGVIPVMEHIILPKKEILFQCMK